MNFTTLSPTDLVNNTNNGSTGAMAAAGFVDLEPVWSMVIRIILASAIFVVGVVGNILVVVVVFKNHRMQTAMNLFLVNLAVCDILVCVFNIPFTLIYFRLKVWPFGLAFCKLLPTLQMANIAASTGSLVAMTVERYRAICMPMSVPISRLHAKLAIALAWMIGIFIALPELGAYQIDKNSPLFDCMEKWPDAGDFQLQKIYSMFLFIAIYVIPLILLLPAYIRMIVKLWVVKEEVTVACSGISQDPQSIKRRKNVLKMMATVVLSYAVCMMPYHAVFLWIDYGTGHMYMYVWTVLNYTQTISWFNSCVNPIIYWFFSEQFSKEFNRILGCNKLRKLRRFSFTTHSSSEQHQQLYTANSTATKAKARAV